MLPKIHRLRATKDFENVTKNGVKVNTEIAVIYAIANPLTQKNSQTGLIVSKTVGNSVQRHKTSRQIRNVVQKMLKQIPNNIQIVIRALPKITEKDFSEIENILKINIIMIHNENWAFVFVLV